MLSFRFDEDFTIIDKDKLKNEGRWNFFNPSMVTFTVNCELHRKETFTIPLCSKNL